MTPREVSEVVEAHRLRRQDEAIVLTRAAYWGAIFAKHNPLEPDALQGAVDGIRGVTRELPSDEDLADHFEAFVATHNQRFGTDSVGEKVKPS